MKRGSAYRKAPEAPYYDRIFRTRKQFHRHYSGSRYFQIWKILIKDIPTSDRILELGCGTGQLAAYLYDQGFRNYLGLDFSTTAIARARNAAPDLAFRVADLRAPDVYACPYDRVVATEVLEHLDDDLTVFGHLRAGTRVHATLPMKDDPSHVRFFPKASGVVARYEPHLDDLSVQKISQWYIVTGRVRGSVADPAI